MGLFTCYLHMKNLYCHPIKSFNRSLFSLCVWIFAITLWGNLFSILQAQTISPKRGVAGDLLNNADCIAADSLSWFYNWANTPNASVISTHQNYLEYCPMLWNGTWNPTALTNYLNAHPEVKYLLAFNEPNYSVQANMTPSQAAALWPQVVAIANAHNLKIVSPAMSYCSGTCLAGYNNQHGTLWLDDFLSICPTCRIDYIGLHVYDTSFWGFHSVVQLYKKYNLPIWITEFDFSGGTNDVQHAALMVDIIDYMEKDPDIFRYAWFLVRSSSPGSSTDIFSQTTGTLSNLGNIYLHMSSYDNNYYHTVNKIIEAEHYISKSRYYCNWNGSTCTWPYSIQLEPTNDISGKLDAYHFASPTANANDTLFYIIDIPTAQTYTIDFRVNSTTSSTISVRTYPGNTLLGTTGSLLTSGAWQTKTLTNVNLSAGKQKIYLTASNGTPLKLNWLRINCTASCGTLPVTLTAFTVNSLSKHSAQLEWITATEENNKEFIIEKSNDGIDFIALGSVSARVGNGIHAYEYKDNEVLGSLNYYRLKQVDQDGQFQYSSIKLLSTSQQGVIVVNQNSIVTELERAQEIYYIITTSSGQIIEEGNYLASTGIVEKKLNLKGLSPGIYIVQLIAQDISYSAKLIIHD